MQRQPAHCAPLIRQGHTTLERQDWQRVIDRYFTLDRQAEFAAARQRLVAGFDPEDYQRRWAELAARIQAAVPREPAGPAAQAFYDEWQLLLAPFKAVATPRMLQERAGFYERTPEWQGDLHPPFSTEVWQFMKAVAATRAASGLGSPGTGGR